MESDLPVCPACFDTNPHYCSSCGRTQPDPGMSQVPSEHVGKKFIVFRSKIYGSSFFSDTSETYQSNWYDILASFDTVEECQSFLGYRIR